MEELEKLKRNNKELQEIINNSWDGIAIIDKDSKFIYLNNAFIPMLGFSKLELKDSLFTKYMQKEDKEAFETILQTKYTQKKYTQKKFKEEISITCIRKDKQKIFLKITISSMLNKNLFVINTRDITALMSDKEIIDDYVTSMHTDLHGHITSVSKAFLELFTFNKNSLIGEHYSKIIHKDIDSLVFKNISKSLQTYQEYSGNLKAVNSKNESFWINMKAKAVYNKYGDITEYTYLLFDIDNEISQKDENSILKKQKEVSQKEIEFKNSLLQEQSKLSIINETLQRLSHEWRQPLNYISIQAQKLEIEHSMGEEITVNKTLDVLNNIKNEANKLSNTIEDFSEFLKPKSNKTTILLEEFFSTLQSDFKEEFKKSNLDFELSFDKALKFDSYNEDLKTVFKHLINNSLENFAKNSINSPKIRIKQNFENGRLYFSIWDNAGGVKSSILNKIFEPYFSTKDEKNGVGLGLYICKMIVNLHLDGIITAKSENENTIIKISIPVEEDLIK